jgi:lysyl-tRNA synthetase class I
VLDLAKCPRCQTEVAEPLKSWKYGIFTVKMYKCSCGNQFREYLREGRVKFTLSAHDGGLGPRIKAKKSLS